MNEISNEIMDKLKKACICKAISVAKIKESIFDGADTFEKVQEATGAGTGGCGGCRCREKIEGIIKEANS